MNCNVEEWKTSVKKYILIFDLGGIFDLPLLSIDEGVFGFKFQPIIDDTHLNGQNFDNAGAIWSFCEVGKTVVI